MVVTLLLLGGTAGLVKGFQNMGALTKPEKYTYNTLFILLTVLLALNMTVSMRIRDTGNAQVLSNTNPTLT